MLCGIGDPRFNPRSYRGIDVQQLGGPSPGQRFTKLLPDGPVFGQLCGDCRRGVNSVGILGYVSAELQRGNRVVGEPVLVVDPATGVSYTEPPPVEHHYFRQDLWCWHVLRARAEGLPDPEPPAERWGHAAPPGLAFPPEPTFEERLAALEAAAAG